MISPFVILGFPDRADPEVAFLEHLTGALYLEKPEEVDRYSLAFNHLVAAAIAPHQTIEFLRATAKDMH